MSCRVVIPDRVIIDKRVPIPGLRALRGRGDDAVRREETSQRGVKPARLEEVNPSQRGLFPLSRKLVVGIETSESIPRLTKGFVQSGGGLDSVRVRGDGGTAEMVSEQEAESPARADGETSCPCEVR